MRRIIALQRELAHELENEDAGEQLVAGNRRGLSLAVGQGKAIASLSASIAALNARIAALDARIAVQDARIATQGTTIALLQGRMTDLMTSLDGYKALRNRVLSTYKRDVLKDETDFDKRIIAAEIPLAHGDAVVDASLYQLVGPGARKDISTFEKLYGLDPFVLPLLSECDMGKDSQEV